MVGGSERRGVGEIALLFEYWFQLDRYFISSFLPPLYPPLTHPPRRWWRSTQHKSNHLLWLYFFVLNYHALKDEVTCCTGIFLPVDVVDVATVWIEKPNQYVVIVSASSFFLGLRFGELISLYLAATKMEDICNTCHVCVLWYTRSLSSTVWCLDKVCRSNLMLNELYKK